MDFLINSNELEALYGLLHFQQLIYLRGIRPYMDVSTGIVGLKRGISHQSIGEQLDIEARPGIKGNKLSRDQVRRALTALERASLITIQSSDLRLILNCPLATKGYFVQNKAAINPPQEATRFESVQSPENNEFSLERNPIPAIDESLKAATPLIKNNNYIIFLLPQFEKFWNLYPLKKSRQKAWEAYQAINPTDALAGKINSALEQQIQFHQQQQSLGQWTAAWKYPANWLTQHCWEDEIQNYLPQEKNHAVHETHHAKHQASRDPLWDSCKSGFESESGTETDDNVFKFSEYRRKSKTY